ncbi:hypothetical protein JWS13_05515 [Rhodococcus pseudokoreensis]|uniref:Uncharacterized protein n=1 Tax=Rhodococcus pseudokoreensis TaxID=2811421 RepID=A0A974ZS79_9NOCA|nr:hypothetical protein [Rhodococcus pseudokoreensis]QSE88122.1 hypothetical protein JWS13_05515 [Rhodococcus pseudokoreensis]
MVQQEAPDVTVATRVLIHWAIWVSIVAASLKDPEDASAAMAAASCPLPVLMMPNWREVAVLLVRSPAAFEGGVEQGAQTPPLVAGDVVHVSEDLGGFGVARRNEANCVCAASGHTVCPKALYPGRVLRDSTTVAVSPNDWSTAFTWVAATGGAPSESQSCSAAALSDAVMACAAEVSLCAS